MQLFKTGRVCSLGLVLLACSQDGAGAAVTQQALDQYCDNGTPQAVFTGSPAFTSPRTYNPANCFKGQVVEVQDVRGEAIGSSGGTGGIPPTSDSRSVKVSWADSPPTDCAHSWLGAYLFEKNSSGTFDTIDIKSGLGHALPDGTCAGAGGGSAVGGAPSPLLFVLAAGKTYRIAASARTAQTSSAPTRMLGIH